MNSRINSLVGRLTRKSSTAQNAALMAVGTLASRLLGLGRIVALAYALGSHSLADVFNLANNAPNTIYDLILGGVISATLLPVFASRLAEGDSRKAWASLSAVFTISTALLLVATAVFELAAPLVIDVYTSLNHSAQAPLQRQAATDLLRLFAPQLFFYGLIALITATLNAKRQFAIPAFAPVINNLVAIVVLLYFASKYPHPSVEAVLQNRHSMDLLGIGTTLGVAFQALSLIPVLRTVGARLRFRWSPRDTTVKEIFSLSGWTAGSVALNQVALIVILALADKVTGQVTAYNYGYLFFQLPYAIAAFSIMSALQPELAEYYSKSDLRNFSRRFGIGLRSSVAIVLPAGAAFLSLGPLLIALVLGHGASGREGTTLIGQALEGFAFGVPGFAAFLAMVQAIQAMKDTRTMFYLYFAENSINVVVALILRPSLGVFGLSLSLSIAYSVTSLVGWWAIKMRGAAPPFSFVRPYVVRSFIGSAALYLTSYTVVRTIGQGTSVVDRAAALIIGSFIGLVAFLAVTELATRIGNRTAGGS